MGETDPVPFEEDLPYEFSDYTLTGRKYTRGEDVGDELDRAHEPGHRLP